MMKPVQLPALITSLSTKVDGSIKIALETQEMSAENSTTLFELRGKNAWVLIAPSEIKDEDVRLPNERPDPAVGSKTPAQRMRAVLYRIWEQSKGGTDFESFYRVRMEQMIDKLKEKLE